MARLSRQDQLRAFVYLVLIFACVAAAGTLFVLHDSTPPDPNDPLRANEPLKAIAENVAEVAGIIEYQEHQGMIPRNRGKDILAEYAREQAHKYEPFVRRKDAFAYGNLLRTAQEWPSAETQFKIAAAEYKGKNEDLWVNSVLRLAHCQAAQGEIPEAIATTKETFSAPPGNKPPILYAVYLEIVPAGLGKGHDLELAALTEGAIEQFEQAVVVESSEPGKVFVAARPHHLRKAWELVMSIYSGAGRNDLAQKASQQLMAALSRKA